MSNTNNNPLTEAQEKVIIMIKDRSRRKPISSHELITFLDIKDKDNKTGANLRSIVNRLRDKGYPICANGRGYYYPQGPAELEEYIVSFQNRIDQQQEACNNLRDKLKNWEELIIAEKAIKERSIQPSQIKLF